MYGLPPGTQISPQLQQAMAMAMAQQGGGRFEVMTTLLRIGKRREAPSVLYLLSFKAGVPGLLARVSLPNENKFACVDVCAA